jgi:integrase
VNLIDIQAAYFADAPDLKPRTREERRKELNRWLKHGSAPVDKAAFAAFRQKLHGTLSATSIEGTVNEVLRLLKFAVGEGWIDTVPAPGRRLKRRQRVKYIPPVTHVGRLYGAAEGEARTFVALAYTTGLRFADLLDLRREKLDFEGGCVRVQASKTSKLQTLPMLPCVRRLLEASQNVAGPVFVEREQETVRRGLGRLCRVVGVPAITPQAIRRCAANAYEHARPGAGSVLLGHSVTGASGFYLSVPTILKDAAASLEIPPEFN